MNYFANGTGLKRLARTLVVLLAFLPFTGAALSAQDGGECIAGDCQDGVGTIEYEDGSQFYGTHEDGEENKGRLHMADGTFAYGNWYKGQPYMGLFFIVNKGEGVFKPETIHYVDMDKEPDSHPPVSAFEGALAITAFQLSEFLYVAGEQDLHLYPVIDLVRVWNVDFMTADSTGSLLADIGSLKIESAPNQQVKIVCKDWEGGCLSDIYGNMQSSITFSNPHPERDWIGPLSEQLQKIAQSVEN